MLAPPPTAPSSRASGVSFAGIYSAQWLPTDGEGRLMRQALAEHVAFEKRQGISGVLALGSTGEFPHLALSDRQEAVALLLELAAPLTVIVNVSDIRPRVCVELGRFAKEAGAAAIAIMPPPFYPVSQDDMLAHFLHVAEHVDLPVVLYNFPELTGKKIELPTISAFAERAQMVAIKQSGAEFAYHQALISLGRELGFVVLSGADVRLPEVFAAGAVGCIGGLVNIVPELMVDVYRRCQAGDKEVGISAGRLTEVGRILDRLTFPANVAAGLLARGYQPGIAKSVQSPVSSVAADRIKSELRAKFHEWGLSLGPCTQS